MEQDQYTKRKKSRKTGGEGYRYERNYSPSKFNDIFHFEDAGDMFIRNIG
jgi:hypothetical protein